MMNKLKQIREVIWPVLAPFDTNYLRELDEYIGNYGNFNNVLEKLRSNNDSDLVNSFFQITKDLYADEEKRLSSVQNRAITLLGATGIVVSLIVNFSTNIIDSFKSSFQSVIGLIMLLSFLMTIIYFASLYDP